MKLPTINLIYYLYAINQIKKDYGKRKRYAESR